MPDDAPRVRRPATPTQGRAPGSFLRAVLENDLRDAVLRADGQSFLALPRLLQFLSMETPGGCHGSPEAVRQYADTALARFHRDRIAAVRKRLTAGGQP